MDWNALINAITALVVALVGAGGIASIIKALSGNWRAQVDELQERVKTLHNDIVAVQARAREQDMEIAVLRNEGHDLRDELAEAKRELAEARRELAQTKRALAELKAHREADDATIRALRQENSDLKQEREALEVRVKELEAKVQTLETELDQVKANGKGEQHGRQ